MYVSVLLHIRLLMEPLATILTRVRPRVRVDQQVCGEGGGSLEGLAALLALEGPLRRVRGPVLAEAHFVSERLVAELASERSPAAVGPPRVDLEAVRRAEHFVAFDAGVGIAGQRGRLASRA